MPLDIALTGLALPMGEFPAIAREAELLQIECSDGLIFSVRTASRAEWRGEPEFEFQPSDAIPVRESAERS